MNKLIEWILSLFSAAQKPKETPQSTTGKDGLALIAHYEGLRLKAYRDPVGVLTIGYGHTGPDVYEGQIITRAQAEKLLQMRLQNEFEPGVRSALKSQPTQKQFDAMVSFAYNLGVAAFRGSTLLRKYNLGDIAGAAAEFERWHYAGGKSLLGLRRRREAEKLVFLGMEVEPAIDTASRVK